MQCIYVLHSDWSRGFNFETSTFGRFENFSSKGSISCAAIHAFEVSAHDFDKMFNVAIGAFGSIQS